MAVWKTAVEKMLKQNKENTAVARKRVDDTRTEVAKHLVKVGRNLPPVQQGDSAAVLTSATCVVHGSENSSATG